MQLDFAFMYKQIPNFLHAGLLTLQIASLGILLSVLIGAVCALIHYYRVPYVKTFVGVYIEISRNTPLLIQIYFLYFGLTALGITWSGNTCALIGLSFLGGSYMSEAFRGGLETVRAGQIEAGKSIGLSQFQILRHVILPQAVAVAMPSLSANCIFLMKETSVIGAIAIPELLHTTNSLMAIYFKTYELMLMLTLAYLALVLPISLFSSWLERRLKHAEFGV